MKTNDETKEGCAILIACLIISVPATIYKGYVLTLLWGWFIIPTFGAPSLRIPAAIGMAATVSYLTHQLNWAKDERSREQKLIGAIMNPIMLPTFALIFGWIVQHWM